MAEVIPEWLSNGVKLTCTGCGAVGTFTFRPDADRFVGIHAQCQVPAPPPPPPTHYGLGDIISWVAKPIAKVFGMDPGCTPCEQRQAALNRAAPRVIRRR